MLKPIDVLRTLADDAHAMSALEGGAAAIQHVSRRVAAGADERLDSCPCSRTFESGHVEALPEADRKLLELGGGQYISSPTHTLADLVRDVLSTEAEV